MSSFFFVGVLVLQCIDKFNIVPTSFLKFCLVKVSHHSGTHYLSFRSCGICTTRLSYLALLHRLQRPLRFAPSAGLCINSNMVTELIMQNTGRSLGQAATQDIAFLQRLQEAFHCSTGKVSASPAFVVSSETLRTRWKHLRSKSSGSNHPTLCREILQ